MKFLNNLLHRAMATRTPALRTPSSAAAVSPLHQQMVVAEQSVWPQHIHPHEQQVAAKKQVAAAVAPPAYAAVADLASSKQLDITFLVGPPRSGTTAVERWLAHHLEFDGNLNQPGLFPRVPAGEVRDRQEALWSYVLEIAERTIKRGQQKVEKATARLGRREDAGAVTRLIVKETSNIVLPGEDSHRWANVCTGMVFMYRSPLLQVRAAKNTRGGQLLFPLLR